MDLSMLQAMIPDVAGWLNVEPATVLLWLGIICTICNLIGRQIPDDKVGVVGMIRDVCKVIGVYAPNKESSNPTPPNPPVVPAFPGLKQDSTSGRYVAEEERNPDA